MPTWTLAHIRHDPTAVIVNDGDAADSPIVGVTAKVLWVTESHEPDHDPTTQLDGPSVSVWAVIPNDGGVPVGSTVVMMYP